MYVNRTLYKIWFSGTNYWIIDLFFPLAAIWPRRLHSILIQVSTYIRYSVHHASNPWIKYQIHTPPPFGKPIYLSLSCNGYDMRLGEITQMAVKTPTFLTFYFDLVTLGWSSFPMFTHIQIMGYSIHLSIHQRVEKDIFVNHKFVPTRSGWSFSRNWRKFSSNVIWN